MASSSQPSIIVHSTPPLEPLPASDVLSLYYIALCQLLSPGRWACTTADWGENAGDLPYITHLGHLIPREHVGSIPAFEDPDAGLSVKQRAEARCWWSYIEQKVTDLMVSPSRARNRPQSNVKQHHSLYSLPPNYPATIGKAQLSTLSFPESQYIPQRLRGIMKPRLDHVGLWGLGGYHRGTPVSIVHLDPHRANELPQGMSRTTRGSGRKMHMSLLPEGRSPLERGRDLEPGGNLQSKEEREGRVK